jgi:hypothetical protein
MYLILQEYYWNAKEDTNTSTNTDKRHYQNYLCGRREAPSRKRLVLNRMV